MGKSASAVPLVRYLNLTFSGDFYEASDKFYFGAATNDVQGELMIYLKDAAGETIATGSKWLHPLPHEWTEVEAVFDGQNDIVRLSVPGCRYEVWYKVGGGGGHELHVDHFNLVATFVGDLSFSSESDSFTMKEISMEKVIKC
jgi:hypothetical protein